MVITAFRAIDYIASSKKWYKTLGNSFAQDYIKDVLTSLETRQNKKPSQAFEYPFDRLCYQSRAFWLRN